MAEAALKIEFSAPNFFAIPLKKVAIETNANTGRTYFIHNGVIVAVGRRAGENSSNSAS